MHGCSKCTKMCGILLLIVGILYLIADLTTWDFFGISWYTAVFILVGIGHMGMSSCADCQSTMSKSKKK